MKTIWLIYPYGEIIGEKFMEVRYIRFGRMLANHGYKVIFWTANFSHAFKKRRCCGWKTINVLPNFDIKLVPSASYKRNISFGRVLFELSYSVSLAKAFRKCDKPDLILTSGTGLLTSFYPVWPYVKNQDIPVIYDIMDVHMFNSYVEKNFKFLTPLAKVLTSVIEYREKPFYHHVSAVCGLGRNQLEIAMKRVDKPVPSCLVYNSVVIDDFREMMKKPCPIPLPEKEPGWIWCVYAGSLGPSYDIPSILKCAELSKRNHDKIRYIIAGAGAYEANIKESTLTNDRIVFLGSLKPEVLPSLYARCDIGLCSYAAFSTVDMPDKFYDYIAAGLAVVNSLQGEIKEYVTNGGTGLQYASENAQSLYECLQKMSDGDSLKDYQQRSYELSKKFDFNVLMRPLLTMVDRLTEERKE